MKLPDPVLALATHIRAAGGRLYVVGGAVRDATLGLPSKDLDLEVHGLDEEDLRPMLSSHGTARRVGQSFPVFKLALAGFGEIDVALPRGEKAGEDPIREASRHRDLTINAMLHDPLENTTLDPWGGQRDLADRRLRAVDPETFARDPLRALRVAVLAARLGAEPDAALIELCRSLDLTGETNERIGLELRKLWLRAPCPSVGISWIHTLGLGSAVLPGVDLGAATQAAIDRVATWRNVLEDRGDGPLLALTWAVLLRNHPAPALVLDQADVHSVDRVPIREQTLGLLKRHPGLPKDDEGLRRLAEHPPLWLALRWHAAWSPSGPALDLLQRAQWLGVTRAPLPTLLQGRDLVALGVSPGPQVGQWLDSVREIQLKGQVSTHEEALTWVTRRIGCAVDALRTEDEPPP